VTKPLINLESAINHPCQALADWKTLDDLASAPRQVRAELGHITARALPLAVPRRPVQMAAHRGMDVVVLRPDGFALPDAVMSTARRPRAASGGSVTKSSDRGAALADAHVCTPRNGARRSTMATPTRSSRCVDARRLVRARRAGSRARARLSFHALPARAPQRRGRDEVLDGPRSRVVREAANRLSCRWPCLHDC
jgi:N-acetylornithine carbamoyltransferase